MATQRTTAQIQSDVIASVYENTAEAITGQALQDRLTDMAVSYANLITNRNLLNVQEFSATRGYNYQEGCFYLGALYQCTNVLGHTGVWNAANFTAVGGLVTSVFGRTGAVVAVGGDYNTSQVTEVTNLYYTNARVNTQLGTYTGDVTFSAAVSTIGALKVVNSMVNDVAWSKITGTPTTLSGYGITDAASGLLTGYVSGAGVVAATDTILQAIQKLNGNIGAIVSSVSSVNGGTGVVVVTVTGTSNRITVTGGTGLTPTIDISSAYVGQNTITTLGTITTGVWTGTAIAAVNGGTGQTVYAVGDLLYASTTTALSKLADVAVGSYLRSGGVNTAPLWSTLTLPNTIAANLIPYATSSNTVGVSTSFFFNGTTLKVGSTSVVKAVSVEIQGQLNINNVLGGSNWSMTDSGTSAYRALINLASTTADLTFFRATGVSGAEAFAETFRITNTAGDFSIGTGATVSARLHVTKTTEQLRVGYNSSNYYSTTVGSTGAVTWNAVGTGATFIFSDSIATPYVEKSALYTLTTNDFTVNCVSGTFSLTLPTAVGCTGRIYNMKNVGTGIITIATTSSQTIDGTATGILTLIQWDNLMVQSDGANWIIIN